MLRHTGFRQKPLSSGAVKMMRTRSTTKGNPSQTQNKWQENPPVPAKSEAVPPRRPKRRGTRARVRGVRAQKLRTPTPSPRPKPTYPVRPRHTRTAGQNHTDLTAQSPYARAQTTEAAHGRQSSAAQTPNAKARTKEQHTAQRTTAPGEGGNPCGPAKGPATRIPEERSQVGTYEEVLRD